MYEAGGIDTPYLAVRGLTFEVSGERLIDVPELALANSGVTAVMGANGAGKSLLLRILHGLVTPTAGDVLAENGPQTSDGRRSQSIVLQSPVLLRRSTDANVRFVLKTRGLDVGRVPELLRRVGLTDKARTPARRLSGGERQRLAIAQALATDPTILLLDEPTASLDPSSTAKIERILCEAVERGTRVVLVTHDVAQARRLASEVVFLSQGKVLEHKSVDRFFAGPETDAARGYLAGRLNV